MTGRLAAVAAATFVAGCGGSAAPAEWAEPQTLLLGGAEPCGPRDRGVALVLRRLTLERDRWRVDASITNRTGRPLAIVRPHTDETFFGVAVFRGTDVAEVARRAVRRSIHVQLVADRFTPALPRQLAARSGWTGTFSGPGRLPRGRIVRVVAGRFAMLGRPPPGVFREFVCVSRHGRVVR